jgi:hypothetical protein
VVVGREGDWDSEVDHYDEYILNISLEKRKEGEGPRVLPLGLCT